jgi:hypothetical protein
MTGGGSGHGFMVAGVIVVVIWSAVTIVRALEISPAWSPLLVGAALLAIGVVRWARGGG